MRFASGKSKAENHGHGERILPHFLSNRRGEHTMIDPLGPELDAAAKNGDTFKAKALLAQGADANFRNEHGATPLIEASIRGYQATVKTLLKHGAIVDAALGLSLAALTGQSETVELLLRCGADINAKDFDGRTALFEAALSGHLKVVAILLERGADTHVRDIGGRTAFSEANVWGEAEVAELLLKTGAYDDATAREMLRENWVPEKCGRIETSTALSKLFQSH
jgi:ankyrin repeat protein